MYTLVIYYVSHLRQGTKGEIKASKLMLFSIATFNFSLEFRDICEFIIKLTTESRFKVLSRLVDHFRYSFLFE